MNMSPLFTLIVITLFLGIISVFIGKIATKTWVSANTGYWMGWLFVITATWVCQVYLGSHGEVSSIAIRKILELHYGAFIGFLIASLVVKKPASKSSNLKNIYKRSQFIINKFSYKLYGLLFIVGLLFLGERISIVGFDLDYFSNARTIYIQKESLKILRIGSHLGVAISFIIILVGVSDAYKSLNLKRLILVILASAPLGLANAGRAFLLNYLLIYIASLLLFRSLMSTGRLLSRDETIRLVTIFTCMLIIFSIIGFLRGGYGVQYNPIYTILVWPASSLMALDSWTKAALILPTTNGINTFGWPSDLLHRFGLIDIAREKETMAYVLTYFDRMNDSAKVIPRTIIPDLIFDFGEYGVFWGMIVIAVSLQFITVVLPRRGVFSYSLAVMSLLAAFYTIQGSIFSPGFCVALLWAGMFSLFYEYHSEKYHARDF